MTRYEGCGKRKTTEKESELVWGTQVYEEMKVLEGHETTTYGVIFISDTERLTISDLSLKRKEAQEFAKLVEEAGDVPLYQVRELLDDFLAR